MAKLSEIEISTAKANHPTATKVSIQDGKIEILVRKPTRAEWKAYRMGALSSDAGKNAAANEALFNNCCLSSDKAALLDENPAIVESTVPILAKLAGFDAKAEADF